MVNLLEAFSRFVFRILTLKRQFNLFMYDFNRSPFLSQVAFSSNHLMAYYISPEYPLKQRGIIKSVTRFPHQKENTQLCEILTKALFVYSKNLEKQLLYSEEESGQTNPTKEEALGKPKYQSQQFKKISETLLSDILSSIVVNADKHGMDQTDQLAYSIFKTLSVTQTSTQEGSIDKVELNKALYEIYWVLENGQDQALNSKDLNTSRNQSFQAVQQCCLMSMLVKAEYTELVEYFKEKYSETEANTAKEQIYKQLLEELIQRAIGKTHSSSKKSNFQNQQWYKNVVKTLKTQLLSGKSPYNDQFWNNCDLQVCLAVLLGSKEVIELFCAGSWSLYLALSINYLENDSYSAEQQSKLIFPVSLCQGYLSKFSSYINQNNNTKGKNPSKSVKFTLNKMEEYYLEVLSFLLMSSSELQVTKNTHKTVMFHQIYQKSYDFFRPFLCQLIGILLFEFDKVDLYSITNNPQYEQEIKLGFLQSISEISWHSLLHGIGYLECTQRKKQYIRRKQPRKAGKKKAEIQKLIPKVLGPIDSQKSWESLLYYHLPYEIVIDINEYYAFEYVHRSQSKLHRIREESAEGYYVPEIIKLIEQRVSDLNSIGLYGYTEKYLQSLFDLYIDWRTPRKCQLTAEVLEVFFLNYNNPTLNSHKAKEVLERMKWFVQGYYRHFYFNQDLSNYLNSMLQRKTTGKKSRAKVSSLFDFMFRVQKMQNLYGGESQNSEGRTIQEQILSKPLSQVMQAVVELNSFFTDKGNSRIKILSLELLDLCKSIHEQIQRNPQIQAEKLLSLREDKDRTDSHETFQQLTKIQSALRQFDKNVTRYVSLWVKDEESKVVEQKSESLPGEMIEEEFDEGNEWSRSESKKVWEHEDTQTQRLLNYFRNCHVLH